MNNPTALDSQERLHLAIHASQQQRHDDAIEHLKIALDGAPEDARIWFLLGAEHAQIGLYERAVEELTKAIELDKTLYTACFQLGLLHLTLGNPQDAVTVWEGLNELDHEDPLYLFKTGIGHLVEDRFEPAARLIEQGISLNTANPALNQDMQRIMQQANQMNQPDSDKTDLSSKTTQPSPQTQEDAESTTTLQWLKSINKKKMN